MANGISKKNVRFPKKSVNHYIKKLNDVIQLNGVLLFGSFAYGNPNKHSDIDLVIISPDFKKIKFGERMQWLHEQRDEISDAIPMDLVGYTPEEFRSVAKNSAIMAKAKKEGCWLYKK
ncbi:hypothetical protein COU00_02420 [Candidatus Falkowbacteria bacterium CG10_big_fil_rev_8_21_14_0_10_43_11]|uniref:Polymerase nucleotidyl transferase domain-containing protein n=1 Tax=Candidatus Falkowbacteria bacterium CG10_big_fil_rev_8_21_14_0_10_43_11 TaxID=1974568 RepID=A0A2M6WM18_9BACT|nr:MAG: hypothetical protein COU00_02420 [Candidatus Falkowbacteria bacterium CG10_big_fil_rev_8_21_14_0_10_43_11]